MSTQESLRLPHRFESPHPSLPHPGGLMGLLSPIVFILFSAVDRIREDLAMGNRLAPKLIRNDLPGFSAVIAQ